jgi:ribose/xylose/arabinose/galactoside ABC-type transport system permease subunit
MDESGARDWIISKRTLGILFVLAGVLAAAGILLLDRLRGGTADFGPSQQLGVAGAVALVVIGLSLLPLGDRPA